MILIGPLQLGIFCDSKSINTTFILVVHVLFQLPNTFSPILFTYAFNAFFFSPIWIIKRDHDSLRELF